MARKNSISNSKPNFEMNVRAQTVFSTGNNHFTIVLLAQICYNNSNEKDN